MPPLLPEMTLIKFKLFYFLLHLLLIKFVLFNFLHFSFLNMNPTIYSIIINFFLLIYDFHCKAFKLYSKL